MRINRPARMFLVLACMASRGAPLSASTSEESPLLRKNDAIAVETGHKALETFRPAYNVAVGITDGVFDLVRVHMFQAVFRGIHSEIRDYQKRDSYETFERKFRSQEKRFFRKLVESYPVKKGLAGRADLVDEHWSWAGGEQVSIVVDSFQDALLDRYRIDSLAAWARRYAQNRKDWDASEAALAAAVGGAFLYYNGVHSETSLGPLKVNVDLRSAAKLIEAFGGGKDLDRAGVLEVGLKNRPIAFAASWDVEKGQVRGHQVGLKYRLSFR